MCAISSRSLAIAFLGAMLAAGATLSADAGGSIAIGGSPSGASAPPTSAGTASAPSSTTIVVQPGDTITVPQGTPIIIGRNPNASVDVDNPVAPSQLPPPVPPTPAPAPIAQGAPNSASSPLRQIRPSAGLKLCNKTAAKISVAWAIAGQISGWQQILPNNCVVVGAGTPWSDVYFYARDDNDYEWPGDTIYCVDPNRTHTFSGPQAQVCGTRPTYRKFTLSATETYDLVTSSAPASPTRNLGVR